jgi:hypothetical protein
MDGFFKEGGGRGIVLRYVLFMFNAKRRETANARLLLLRDMKEAKCERGREACMGLSFSLGSFACRWVVWGEQCGLYLVLCPRNSVSP